MTRSYIIFYLIGICLLLSCKNQEKLITLKQVQILSDYPSGSGLAYLDGSIYLVGDDASYVLVTDTSLNETDRIELYKTDQKRIAKNIKEDLEAIAVIQINKKPALLLTGSGSLSPRNFCWIIDPVTREKSHYNLDSFYNRLRQEAIRDLNIEGAAFVQDQIVLASRGNKTFPKNFLIFTSKNFWRDPDSADIKIVKAGANTDSSFFNGISGIDYSYKSDRLLLTVSTENTYSSHGDGEIGKSYLWFINNISSKKRYTAINPDRVIDLEELDPRLKSQKIESVCIIAEDKKEMELLLVSDDDKGGTVLFRISVEK